MKKVKVLLIVNIIQIILLIASIIASIFILPNILSFGESSVPPTVVLGTELDSTNGFAQVTSYGAIPNDGKDDTSAFKKALKTNASLYIPVGTYDLNETLLIDSITLKGCGSTNTVIRSNADNVAISVKGNAIVEDITVEFVEKAISGEEKSGEKVAIEDAGLLSGSMIRGVGFKNFGTGFLSNSETKGAFCTTLEAITFSDFSYKAIEIKNGLSTVIRSATIGKGKSNKLTPVSLGGVATVETMNFSETECEYAFEMVNADSVIVRNISFTGTKATSKSLINCANSRFTLQNVTLLDTDCENLININDADNKELKTDGTVSLVYSNTGDVAIDKDGIITIGSVLK